MIVTKSQREIDLMREAGRIVASVHKRMKEVIQPGITTAQLDAIAEEIIVSAGATPSFKNYNGFPASVCVSVNEVVVHGIPGAYALKEGDIISVDVGACYEGYHGDSAWTYAVGEISPEAQRLMEVTEKSLFEGLKYAKSGNRLSDISHAIGEYLRQNGYSTPIELSGHGIGTQVHEDPSIMNFGLANRGPVLKSGMTLAIEPMAHAGKRHIKVLNDGWTTVTKDGSLAAHYEHTIVITDSGYMIFTKL